jgi:hypothetical protein
LSKRWPGLFLVLGVVTASAAVITAYAAAGLTTYVSRPGMIDRMPALPIFDEPQTPNRLAKTDRVALLLDSPSYTDFSSAPLAVALERLPTAAPANWNGLLNDAQIAGIGSRLRLTPRQAEYWPAVAAALREVGRRYFQAGQHRKGGRCLDMSSPEVQQLIAAAAPLILQLSDEQKREVRQLVRVIGLEKVASQI